MHTKTDMHGVSRVEGADAAALEKKAKKASDLRAAQAAFVAAAADARLNHLDGSSSSSDLMALSFCVAQLNPEFYSIWNCRRRCILPTLANCTGDEEFAQILGDELGLVQRILPQHPKAYALWSHRLWALGLLQGRKCVALVEREYALIDKMLSLDERNFHAWAYRLLLNRLTARDAASEMMFATSKIKKNFSNYSAWHYRLHYACAASPHNLPPPAATAEDLDMAHTAFFTDADDQSAWVHYSFLIQITGPRDVVCTLWARAVVDGVQLCLCFDRPILPCLNVVSGINSEEIKTLWVPVRRNFCCLKGGAAMLHCDTWCTTLPSAFVGTSVRVCIGEDSDVHSWGVARGLKLRSHFFEVALPASSSSLSSPLRIGYARIVTERDGCSVALMIDVDSESKLLSELRELEPNNKWVVAALCDVISCDGLRVTDVLPLLQELQGLDPKRRAMYRDREDRMRLLMQAQETPAPMNASWHPSLNPYMPLFVD
jgi:geranylgeranyl transferase type-2 subunit alpha